MTSGTDLDLPSDSIGSHPASPQRNKLDLHVLTITPFFPFKSNPVYGAYVSEPIERFAELGLQSSVIGVSPLHRGRRSPLADGNAEWLRYPQIPGNAGLATAGKFLYRRLLPHVTRLHRQRPIDVIHAHSALPCGHAASLLSESLHVPFVVTVHGLDVFNACFQAGTRGAKRRAALSAEVYRHAASVICISRTIENILKKGIEQPVPSCVIYNGTDDVKFSPEEVAANGDTANLLIVGNLLRGKGHEIVLRAMARIAPRFPKLQCKIIGEGPDQGRFAELTRTLGISGRVFFMGRQDRQAVAKAMRACAIFALPSRFEGLGCAYLEAMACARPVIACEGQGIGEIIQHGHNGWLIPIDDVEKMADALFQLLGSGDLRTSIGSNARKTILNGLTMTNQVRQLDEAYRNLARPWAR